MTTDRLFLCVDAGGTKTAAAVANEHGDIVSEGFSGPANMSELGLDTAAREILAAVNHAISAIPALALTNGHHYVMKEQWRCPIRFEKTWIGVSGCDTPLDVENLTARLKPSFLTPIAVMNDALLLSLPLQRHHAPWCVAVIAGTGSITYGIGRDGTFAKRGGFGHLFGDTGSAYHLGLTAIRLAAETFDEEKEMNGGLAAVLRKRFDVEHTCDVPARCHDVPPDLDPISASNARKLRIASLAPDTLALSSTCPLAKRAVNQVARELAQDIAVIARSAVAKGHERAGGGLVIAGGLGVQDAYLCEVLEELRVLEVSFEWVERVVSPARHGAVLLGES